MKTVNFIEAYNSGIRFRPVNWNEDIDGVGWYHVFNGVFNGELVFSANKVNEIVAIIPKMINWDYILEEKSITITESEFDDAFKKQAEENSYFPHSSERMGWIKKELGF